MRDDVIDYVSAFWTRSVQDLARPDLRNNKINQMNNKNQNQKLDKIN